LELIFSKLRHFINQTLFNSSLSFRIIHQLPNMPSFTFLTVALALTGTAIANPIQKRDTFSIQQVEHSKFLKNGPGEIARTMRKYGKAVPEHIEVAAHHRAKVRLKSTFSYEIILT
jgi:hypothetical protein